MLNVVHSFIYTHVNAGSGGFLCGDTAMDPTTNSMTTESLDQTTIGPLETHESTSFTNSDESIFNPYAGETEINYGYFTASSTFYCQ